MIAEAAEETAGAAAPGKAWLRDLEEKVQEASALLRELRAENSELRQKVSNLEEQLRLDGEATEPWQEERKEIRERVEKLVDHLSDLLTDG